MPAAPVFIAAGRVAVGDNSNYPQGDALLVWDGTNDRLGINTADPQATLHVNGPIIERAIDLPNVPANGPIGTVQATVDDAGLAHLHQTTAGRILTLPAPSAGAAARGQRFTLINRGTVTVTVAAAALAPGDASTWTWDGAWVRAQPAGSGGGSPTITNLLTAVGSSIVSTVNGVASALTPADGAVTKVLGFDVAGQLVKADPAAPGTTHTLGLVGQGLTSTVNGVGSAVLLPIIGVTATAPATVATAGGVANVAVPTMGAATGLAGGTGGLVPPSAAGDQAKLLSGAGTWVDSAFSATAALTTFTPGGDLAAVNVQAALLELDAEKSSTFHNHSGVYDPFGEAASVVGAHAGIGPVGAHGLSADAAAGTASLRTLGTGPAQAAAGNDARLSDTRTPTDGTVTNASVAAGAAIDLSKLAVDPLARANHTGTQTAATISNLAETVDDRVAALLVAGANVSLTYNDPAGTLTIGSTGGGGGGGPTGFLSQRLADRPDWDTLVAGFGGHGSVSGGEVTAQTVPDMTAHVAAGTSVQSYIGFGDDTWSDYDVVVGPASGEPRWDLVWASYGSNPNLTQGTPDATDPLLPATPILGTRLAAIYVTPAMTVVTDADIYDLRIFVRGLMRGRNLDDVADAATARFNLGIIDGAPVALGGDLTGMSDNAEIADGVIVNTDINAAAAIALSKLATNPLARANHTGTQTASTISDLAAAAGAVAVGGDLTGTVSNAQIAAGAIVDADVNASAAIALSKLATDPLARANHTGSQLAATISNFAAATAAVAVGGDLTGTVGGASIAAGAVTVAKLAFDPATQTELDTHTGAGPTGVHGITADAAAGTASLRTLGTGATQAAAGNDARLSDTRTPTAGTVTNASVAAGAAIVLSKLAVDPLARANHTGSQLAATISNFDTQVRTSRLDQMAAPTAAVAMGGQLISNVADPASAQDAATKAYVDSSATSGLDVKEAVRATSTGNLTLSGEQTVDGVALVTGNRVLVRNQTAGEENGIYVAAAGAWSRATDADTSGEVGPGLFVFTSEGTANANSGWVLTTNDPITLGTTPLEFTQFSGAGQTDAGAALTKTGNTFDVAVDGSTIEVNADALRVKAGGITANELGAGAVTAGKIGAGAVVNADISASAAIVLSKLATDPLARANHTGTQLAATVSNFAEAVDDRVAGLLVQGSGVTLTYDDPGGSLTVDVAVNPAGIAVGGDLTGTVANAQIAAGAIVDADVNASAAIALSKLATDPLARANHTGSQLASTVSDFSEAVDDRVGALVVAGAGIDATYNDAAGSLTIAANTTGIAVGGDLTGTVANAQIAAGAIVNADVAAGAAIALSKLATDPLARVNHTGSQLAATVSDLAEAVDDRVAALLIEGVGVNLTYNDAAGSLTIAADTADLTVGGDLTGTVSNAQIAAGAIVNADVGAAAAIALSKLATDPLARANHTGTQLAATISDFNTAAGAATVGGDLTGTVANAQIAAGAIVNADVNAAAAIALSKLEIDPSARASHTGTQLAATISNFDAQVHASRLDQMAAPTTAVAFGAQKITGLADPALAQDAATKAYVDSVASGLDPKASVRVATTANITLSGAQTIDGVAVIAGDRVLVKNQTTASQNGIYVAAAAGWSRPADADTDPEVTSGLFTFVTAGTVGAGTGWVLTTADPISVGATGLTFTQFSGAGVYTAGAGLVQTGAAFDVNPDGSTLEISADTVRVKAGGVGSTHLAAAAVTAGKIGAGAIVDADINAAAAIALSKLATNPLARANHTGTQTASTISDFSEAVDDRVGVLVEAGTGIDVTYNDVAGTLTIAADITDLAVGGDLSGSVSNAQIGAGVIVNADINAAAAIALSKLATDPLARANHTGTQLAATVSDLAEAVDDRVAVLAVAGAGIDITYNDAAGSLTFAADTADLAVGGDLTGTVSNAQIAAGAIVNADVNAAAAIALSKLATNPLARANHTGTQLLSTISDAGTMAAQNATGVAITGGTIAGITDLAVADGGTGASDAATARTNLGVGSDAAAGTASMRTLGTSSTSAAAGNDARLSDTRTPTDGSVTLAKYAAGIAITYVDFSVTWPARPSFTGMVIWRGSTTAPAGMAEGDLWVDESDPGSGGGGDPALGGDLTGTASAAQIAAGVIVNADINAAAAIALSKLATDPLARANHTGSQSADTLTDGTTNKAFLGTERTKLAGIATGATANSTDATLLARANHTGTQLAATVSDFNTAAAGASAAGAATVGGDLTGTVANAQIAAGAIVNADVNAAAAIALSKLAVDPLARANHTGTQLAATVSNFDTQVRTSRIDQMATPTASVAWGSQRITGLLDPASAQDAATKAYVDSVSIGLDVKASVRAASTGNLTLSGAQTIDGVAVIAGDRVLAKDQSTGSQNGIYVAAAGAWSRSTDADANAEVTGGLFTFVSEGTVNGNTGWVLTTDDPIVLASTALVFAQFSGAGQITAGNALTKTGNTLDVAVDGSTIEVNADALRVKASGITSNELGTGAVTAGKIGAGAIVNADVGAGAAIALSKLATDPLARANHTGTQLAATISDFATAASGASAAGAATVGGDLTGTVANAQLAAGAIVNADIAAGAAIALTKLATDPLARANHTGTQLAATVSDFNSAASGASAAGAATVGGDLTGTVANAQIAAGAIVNADVNASAAIALSKLATDPLARANHTGTQTASTVSDFAEAVDDRVGALTVAGVGIAVTYNDAGGTLTIESTGMVVVSHGATAGTARPAGAVAVYWIGSVLPTNAIDSDLWYDTDG